MKILSHNLTKVSTVAAKTFYYYSSNYIGFVKKNLENWDSI